jgi:hypothetical protein
LDLPTPVGIKSQSLPAAGRPSTTTRSRNAPRSHVLRSFHGIFPQAPPNPTPQRPHPLPGPLKKIASPRASRRPAGTRLVSRTVQLLARKAKLTCSDSTSHLFHPAGATRPRDPTLPLERKQRRTPAPDHKQPKTSREREPSVASRKWENSGAVDHLPRRTRPASAAGSNRTNPTHSSTTPASPAMHLNKSPSFATPTHGFAPLHTY